MIPQSGFWCDSEVHPSSIQRMIRRKQDGDMVFGELIKADEKKYDDLEALPWLLNGSFVTAMIIAD